VTGTSEAIFVRLETGPVGRDMRLRDSDVLVQGGPVCHAVDRRVMRHLLVPLAAGQPGVEDSSSRGVRLTERELIDGRHRGRYLDVSCELAELRDVFAVFCDDLLAHLGAEDVQPVAACLDLLERWRELLTPARSPLLGPGTLAGLLTELHLMEEVSARAPGDAAGLWTGPDAARADFTGLTAAVEAKATTGRERVLVEIHGLRQLDEGPLQDVYLYVEQLEAVSAGGDSVPDVVSRLLNAGVDRSLLLRGLASVGYDTAHAPAYRMVRFTVVSRRTFRATAAGFPRLVPMSLADPGLADRVFRVAYTIDVTDSDAVAGHLPSVAPAVEHLLKGGRGL
jgi:Putative  PD-(D/E)XK family member, (DUF4420)